MAIKVKDAAAAAKKFVTRGQAAAGDYKDGVTGAGQDWQAKTTAAADSYAQGVQDAIGRGAFAKGVNTSGGAYYEQKAAGIGAQRFPQGIAQAGPDWQKGVEPYLQTISSLSLPPRGPKGAPQNMDRAAMVAMALRRRKVGA